MSRIKLGLSMRYLGYHIAAWRHPDFDPGSLSRFEAYRDIAQKAEAEKLDMIFFADGLAVRSEDKPAGSLSHDMRNAELEPITLLSAIAAVTSRIGLVATASTTYNEPYHVARKYASLDHISGGRAGWNVVTSWSEQEALNFSRISNLPKDERYDRALEFVEVVRGLWDSFEEDAFTHDKTSGQFYDPDKRHVLDHKGKFFQVRGPLTSARPPQGHPLIVQAGASDQGRNIAAQYADVVYTVSHSVEEAREFYADLKARAAHFGRRDNAPLIMPALAFYVGETTAQAQAKLDELQRLIDPLAGLALLYTYVGDLSAYDIDKPIPEEHFANGISIGSSLIKRARDEGLTIRQLYELIGAGYTVRYVVGTAEEIVDDMQLWVESGAADGFNLCPPILPHSLDDLSAFILPELRRRGLFRTEYEGRTLRENLGLTSPLPSGA
ncbi:FMN-dependent oxidoreductase (nitrilotriacetate monooxygenase family) [Pseudochelatococcus lubricantis]|uniref:FMN-dependent oxidoreductase (Nitrilotriacetate monooxygenase family) n=1 Tax=Pseudochelatococcus lubricantis TaxID=1538102 RepID=A0ABX0V0M5_9HYPH|nr:LLM class flavin-dependent oxidoreductase [Pseudochelatococcus lubricantis]NIJ58717.1 FMN-dependent oxidoreductase (nitrilotriacetate monooxygenase family) [Pseudochelatococcus lubricantis]